MRRNTPLELASQEGRGPSAAGLLRFLLRPSRFALVGILGIAVNALALLIFTEWLGIYYAVSAILASQVSTVNNFVLTELWVFRGRHTRRHIVVRFLAFDAINIATLFIRVPVMVAFTEFAGLHYLISNLIAIGLTFGLRYFLADNWIWAGRDWRDQTAVGGWFNYDIHDIVRVRSRIALPELAAFNVDRGVEADIVVARHRLLGGGLRARISVTREEDLIRYREHLGLAGVAFDVHTGPAVLIEANWLLSWSHHVLYTNIVEPVLRFLLVSRDAVLLHSASVVTERGALLLSAQTDTGKTSTLLRLLMERPWSFLGDDMAIVRADGTILSYPKPMTLSAHTMKAVSSASLPLADRIMLAIRSRVHSKEGRSIGHAISRWPVPIVTINAVVQLLVPPPKYHVNSLIDCELSDSAQLDSVILMERGEPLTEPMPLEPLLDELLANTEDAYTFPPFAWFSPLLRFDGRDVSALRGRERELVGAAVSRARRFRLRVRGHEWSTLIPDLFEGQAPDEGPGTVIAVDMERARPATSVETVPVRTQR